jgi:NAD(P)H-hydrate epimerase
MRALDEAAIAGGIPGKLLMERAGSAAAELALSFSARRFAPEHARRWIVLAGKGNNGGDAYVVARVLCERDARPVFLYSVCPRTELTDAARLHADRLPASVSVEVCAELPAAALAPGGIVIDGLLGTGVTGPPRAVFARWIDQVNASGLPVIALDVPSGLDADTGAGDLALTADLTITMGLPKRGLLTPPGLARCGCLRVVDIGLPPDLTAAAESCGEAVVTEDIRPLLPRRPHDVHKNRCGHALIVGGSAEYVGAPLLAGAAALRSGCGLVTIGVPASLRPLLHPPLDALILRCLADTGSGSLGPDTDGTLAACLDRSQAVAFGPGIGSNLAVDAALAVVLQSTQPAVIDADGLRALARHPELVKRHALTMVTPHPGEMRVLLAGFGLNALWEAPRVVQARELARTSGLCVILKGQGTVIATPDGRLAVNTSGTSGLATAGSGDVLTGLLAGLLAQGMNDWAAACTGVHLHGLAAELTAVGDRALTADDLVAAIGPVFRTLTPFG